MKPTLKFCLLVLVCILVLVGYSLLPDRPAIVGDWGLKQVEVQKLHTEHADKTAKKPVLDETATEETVVDKPSVGDEQRVSEVVAGEKDTLRTVTEEGYVEADSTRQTILFFGDSMVGGLCMRLNDYAVASGHKMISVSWKSSTTRKWANTDTLDNYIARYKPTYVFVCLGSNEFLARDLYPIKQNVQKILSKLHGLPTIWIGPPSWCEDYGFDDALSELMGDGAYFRSSELTYSRQKDGRHPNMKSYSKWADAVVEWMRTGHSIHPISMVQPQKKGKLILFLLPTKTDQQKKTGKVTHQEMKADKPSDELRETKSTVIITDSLHKQ